MSLEHIAPVEALRAVLALERPESRKKHVCELDISVVFCYRSKNLNFEKHFLICFLRSALTWL